jgi:hypothetical protein
MEIARQTYKEKFKDLKHHFSQFYNNVNFMRFCRRLYVKNVQNDVVKIEKKSRKTFDSTIPLLSHTGPANNEINN